MLLFKIVKEVIILLCNNILINNFLIVLKKDYLIKKTVNNWTKKEYDNTKTPQENVGCSTNLQMQNLVDKSHEILKEKIQKYFRKHNRVLDIGSGTGLYLADFPDTYSLTGIDLNKSFLEISKSIVPKANLIQGHYLKEKINLNFDVIISFGVLMYFEPSSLPLLFNKLYTDLNENGIILIQYSHAMSLRETFFPDLSYVKYSPKYLERIAGEYFDIIEHKHFYDDRKVGKYDKTHYYYPDGKNNRLDTIQNTYLLIAQKKKS